MTSTSSSPRADFALIQVDPPAVSPVTLTWQNLSVSEPGSHTKHPDVDFKRPLLQGVSGAAQPGELLAIAGPSSSGTSVLLECLAQYRTPTTGELCFQPRHPDASPVGFVAKQNLVFGALTVLDHLTYQAQLRLAHDNSDSRVLEVATQLGLMDHLDALIGVAGAANALALDTRKLVAIAAELLSLPSVLLLDESTSGMDAFQAERVVLALQALARKGHTIVMTLSADAHSSTFGLIDKLMLLADGRVVYNGVTAESLTIFEDHGVGRCPSFMNPFEFFQKQLTVPVSSGTSHVDQLVAAWSARQLARVDPSLDDVAVLTRRDTATVGRRQYPTRWTQYSVLLRRNLTKLARDTASIKTRLGAMVVLMLLVGLVFIRLDLTQRDIQPFSSACFFIATTQFFYNVLPELLSAPKEVATALHEQRSGQYHALRWYIVKNVTELPLQVLYPLVFLVPTYFMVGFTVDLETFFKFYLFIVLLASAATGIAYFFSCVAPDAGRAIKLSLVYLSPSLVFGGAFVTRKTTPVYFVWLQQLSPIKYCYHGLMRAFWKPVASIYCAPNTACRATSGLAVLMINVVEPNKFLSDVVILLIINIAFRVLGGVALAWRARKSTATLNSCSKYKPLTSSTTSSSRLGINAIANHSLEYEVDPSLDDVAVLTRRDTATVGRRQYPTRWTQYSVLLRRNLTKLARDTASIKTRLGAMVVLMLLVGLVFIRLDLTQRDIQPFSSACFFIATTQFFYNVLPELLSAPKEVATALHEQRSGQYHALRWYIVKNVTGLPLQVLYPLVFLVPTYFMVGFTVDLETFFKFYLFIVLLASAATGIAYFFSCVAPDAGRAIKLSLVYLSPSLVFGGAFVTRKTTPVYFVWLQQLSPIKYCYHGLMRAFWKPVASIYCAPNTACRATSGLAVLMINVVEPNKFLSDVVILLIINIAFRVLGGVALAWRARKSTAVKET